MFNTQDSLKRRLVYSAHQLKSFQHMDLPKPLDLTEGLQTVEPISAIELDDEVSFILGYN